VFNIPNLKPRASGGAFFVNAYPSALITCRFSPQ